MMVLRCPVRGAVLVLCVVLVLSIAAAGQGPDSLLSPDAARFAVQERLGLGQNAMARRAFSEACAHFSRVLQLDWNNPQVYAWWCAAKDSAAAQIRQLVESGDCEMSSGRYGEAVLRYTEALVEVPVHGAADTTWVEIRQKLRAARRKAQGEHYLVVGLAHFLREEYGPARAALDSALACDPHNRSAAALGERIEVQMGASADIATLQKDPEVWAMHLEALKYYRAADYHAALALWEKILARYPGHPDVTANIRQARLRLPAADQTAGEIANGRE